MKIIAVGLGGCIGAVLRYLVSGWTQGMSGNSTFPVGTLAVNAAGCLVIGYLGGLSDNAGALSAMLRLFLLVGVLGGFTTFSTFGYETMALVRDGQLAGAMVNVFLQVGIGLGAAWGGYALSAIGR